MVFIFGGDEVEFGQFYSLNSKVKRNDDFKLILQLE